MPANYAHYRFGQLVLTSLPIEERKLVLYAMDSFNVGIHGPDVLFYYKPLCQNAINQRGNRLHEEMAFPFFEKAKEIYQGRNCPEEDLSYLFGFICHFVLDSVCHPIVEKTMKDKDVPHVLVESSFDRKLLEKTGKDPESFDTTQHIQLNETTIQDLVSYLSLGRNEAQKCLRSMRFYSHLLRPNNPLKRAFLRLGTKGFGVYDSVYKMVIPEKNYHELNESDSLLYRKMNESVMMAVSLIANSSLYVKDGAALDERFKRNYEA